MTRVTPALMRGLDVLELFVSQARKLSATQIIELTNFPKTSVHELLKTFVERGYLNKDDAGMYTLGYRALQLGNAYAERIDMLGTATDIARDIAAEYSVICSVAVLDGVDVFYLAKVEGREIIPLPSSVGKRVPAHATGLGKILLSLLSEIQLDQLYPTGQLVPLMPNTIRTLKALKSELVKVRAQGYATESEESTANAACMAVPVRSVTGNIAALSITVTTTRWQTEPIDYWLGMAREGAARIAAQLGAA